MVRSESIMSAKGGGNIHRDRSNRRLSCTCEVIRFALHESEKGSRSSPFSHRTLEFNHHRDSKRALFLPEVRLPSAHSIIRLATGVDGASGVIHRKPVARRREKRICNGSESI